MLPHRSLPFPWILALLTFALIWPGFAADWPQWRGPAFNGSSDETGLPESFGPEENVRWAVELPGPAAATPIIGRDRLYISTVDLERKVLLAMSFEATTGRRLWQHETGVGIQRDRRSNYAAPSPVTDGERVWFFYSTGQLAAFDRGGQTLWSRDIQDDYGEFAFLWTFSSSPLLYDGKLYLQVLQRNVPVSGRGRKDGPIDSFLLALDPATGRELWRTVRPSQARQESREAFSTPVPLIDPQRPEILLVGGDCITGHNPANGAELWRWGTWNKSRITHWRLVTSPVVGEGVILACAPKGGAVYALPAGSRGELEDSALVWTSKDREVSSDVPTPLYYRERFYILNGDRRVISCVEPASGRVIWTGSLEGATKLEASPTGADGKIYLIDQRGTVFVLKAGDTFKVLHRTELSETDNTPVRASVAVAHRSLYIRAGRKLYCLGKD